MKFLNEVSHVSPYFKVHWNKCSVLKRSEGILIVILSRLVGQLEFEAQSKSNLSKYIELV